MYSRSSGYGWPWKKQPRRASKGEASALCVPAHYSAASENEQDSNKSGFWGKLEQMRKKHEREISGLGRLYFATRATTPAACDSEPGVAWCFGSHRARNTLVTCLPLPRLCGMSSHACKGANHSLLLFSLSYSRDSQQNFFVRDIFPAVFFFGTTPYLLLQYSQCLRNMFPPLRFSGNKRYSRGRANTESRHLRRP